MTKLTVTQAAGAIRNETTAESITAVLMDCTKAVMAEVYAELTGEEYSGSLNSLKKAELASEIAQLIQRARENEAFKALTVKEKLEELRDAPYSSKLLQCSLEELKEMASLVGVYDSDYADEDEYYWRGTVQAELRAMNLVKDCRKIASEGETKDGTAKERILFRLKHMSYAERLRMEEMTGVESTSLEEAKEQIAEYFLKEEVATPESKLEDVSAGVENDERKRRENFFGVEEYQRISGVADMTRVMLRKYAELPVILRAIRDGVKVFRRAIEVRTEQGLRSDNLCKAIENSKEEYRQLRIEGFRLRRKLRAAMSEAEIVKACLEYELKCDEARRRHKK